MARPPLKEAHETHKIAMASPQEPPSGPPPPQLAMDHQHYDYRIMQPQDFAAHMQMPHIPLPLDTPLPPSSYDFTAHGAFQMPQNMQGPQAHPLFEGVLAMHQMLGHDLNLSWPDVAECNQQSSMSYADSSAAHYACAESVEQISQWSPPPPPLMDPTPSPLEESMPHTPEHIIELVSEPVAHRAEPSPSSSQGRPTGFAMFPLVVTGAKTHEHTIAFQADVRFGFGIHSSSCLPLILATKVREGELEARSLCSRFYSGEARRGPVVHLLFSFGREAHDVTESQVAN